MDPSRAPLVQLDQQRAVHRRAVVSPLGGRGYGAYSGRARGRVRRGQPGPCRRRHQRSHAALPRGRGQGAPQLLVRSAPADRRADPIQPWPLPLCAVLGLPRGHHWRPLRLCARHDLLAGQPQQRHQQVALGHGVCSHRAHQGRGSDDRCPAAPPGGPRRCGHCAGRRPHEAARRPL
ncbi:hypothetical protein D3C78_1035430 [compost metagenome]